MKFRFIEVEASGDEAAEVVKTFQALMNGNGHSVPVVAAVLPARGPRKAREIPAAVNGNGANGHVNGNGNGHMTIADRIRQFCAASPRTRSDITAHLRGEGVETTEALVNQHLYLLTKKGDLLRDDERGVWRGKR